MTGTTLAHYRITAKLGEGGMGEVYRATDLRLGRDVAIKVLPAEMAASQERLDRFQREAQALAALDHPNIVLVYSVESAEWAGTRTEPEASPLRVHFMANVVAAATFTLVRRPSMRALGELRLVNLGRHPQSVQQHRELTCHGDNRTFLRVLLPPRRESESPAAEIGIR